MTTPDEENLDPNESKIGVPRGRPVQYLEPREVLLLDYAGNFTTDQDHYGFWGYRYGIDDVPAALNRLVERGLLVLGDRSGTLEGRTVTELKKELGKHGLKVSGKKAILVDRLLQSVSDEALDERFPERRYVLTDLGKMAVEENEYIGYVHGNQRIPDLDIDTMAAMVIGAPGRRWRDLIWGYLNQQTLVHAKAGDWGLYRNTKHAMAEFVAEESRWRDAIALLAEVIYFDLSGLGNGFKIEYFSETVQYLFPYERSLATIPPGLLERVFRWAENAGINEEELRSLLMERLRRLNAPLHLFTKNEILQIVFLERDGNTVALTELYEIAERRIKNS